MKRCTNLYFSRQLRFVLLSALPAVLFAPAFAQMAPMAQPNAKDLIPNVGTPPELLTVVDMRGNSSQAEKILAKSIEGLFNSETSKLTAIEINTDKIYIVLNDQDARWLKWLTDRQYILSSATVDGIDALLRRWPDRWAVLCDDKAPDVAAAVAACDRQLLVTDPSLIKKYHLIVAQDLRGKWKSEDEARNWLFDHYRDQLNQRIVGLVPTTDATDLIDYQIANKMFTFTISAGHDDAIVQDLVTRFDSNVPCLYIADPKSKDAGDEVNKAGKFLLPVNGLGNLSVWTVFHPYDVGAEEQDSGAVAHPRLLYHDPYGVPLGGWFTPDTRPSKDKMPWLRELAPPVYESWARQRNGGIGLDRNLFRMGMINESVYGAAYGTDRERIWTQYLNLSRDCFDLANGR